MATHKTIIRVALAAALLVLAGVFIWVGVTRSAKGPGGEVILAAALLPLAAAGLLSVRRDRGSALAALGTTLAIVVAPIAALIGYGISFCMCQAPLSAESIALMAVAAAVFPLAVADIALVGLVWIAIVIAVAVLASSGTVGLIAAGIIVAAAVAWLIVKARRSAPPPG